MNFLEKLNHYGIDWCFQCASLAWKKSNKKKQDFTYNLIQFMRKLDPKTSWEFSFINEDSLSFNLKPGILEKFTGTDIEKYKYKKSFYKGLIPILEEHLKNCGSEKIYKFKIHLDKGNLSILIH